MKHEPLRLLFLFARKRRAFCFISAVILLLAAAWTVLFRTSYATEISALFDPASRTADALRTVMNSGLGSRVTVCFSPADGSRFDAPEKLRFLENVTAELEKSPLIRDVICRRSAAQFRQSLTDFTAYFPQYFPPEAVDREQKELDALAGDLMRRLMVMPPGMSASFMENDPFSLSAGLLRKLEDFLAVSGFRAEHPEGAFVSPDGTKCLMILTTGVPGTDTRRCGELVHTIRRAAETQAPDMKTEIFSVHTHTLDNEKGIRRDLKLFGIASVILFTLIFAGICRGDLRGLAIPFLAGCAGLLGAAGVSLLCRHVLVFILALGGVLIGLGVDYGIHLYTVSLMRRKLHEAVAVLPPLFCAFLTSGAAFFCFLFSGVPAFVQFGTFALLTLGGTFFLMIWILPGLLFRFRRFHPKAPFMLPRVLWEHPRVIKGAAVLALLLLTAGAFRVRFDPDIRNFDLARQRHGAQEEACRRAFFREGQPVPVLYRDLSVMADDLRELREKDPSVRAVGASDFFCSPEERCRNIMRWREFMESGKYDGFRGRFRRAAEKAGFEEAFFRDFFTRLEEGVRSPRQEDPELLRMISSALGGGKQSMLLLLAPGTDCAALRTRLRGLVLEENAFLQMMFRDLCGRMKEVSFAAVLLILLCVRLYLGSFRKTLPALLPLGAGLLAVAGIHGLAGSPLTLSVLVSCIVTAGIAVDYGLLVTAAGEKRFASAVRSVTFSAVTTAAGGMTVIFAEHPMLRAAGLTIIAGIAAAWLAGLFLLPLIFRWKVRNMFPLLAAVLLLPGLCACRSVPFEEPVREPVPEETVCRVPGSFSGSFEASAVLDYMAGSVTFLIAGESGPEGTFLTGLSPAGIKLFEIGKDRSVWREGVLPAGREETLSPFLYRAFDSFLAVPSGTDRTETVRGGLRKIVRTDGADTAEFLFSGPHGTLIEVIRRRKSGEIGEIRLYPDGNTGNIRYIYEEHGTFLRLIVRFLPEQTENER